MKHFSTWCIFILSPWNHGEFFYIGKGVALSMIDYTLEVGLWPPLSSKALLPFRVWQISISMSKTKDD